jgi:urea transport system permease protein
MIASFSSIDFPPAGRTPRACADAAEALAMAIGETDARIEALNKAVATADDKTAPSSRRCPTTRSRLPGDKVFIVRDDKGFDPVTGAEVPVPAETPRT